MSHESGLTPHENVLIPHESGGKPHEKICLLLRRYRKPLRPVPSPGPKLFGTWTKKFLSSQRRFYFHAKKRNFKAGPRCKWQFYAKNGTFQLD